MASSKLNDNEKAANGPIPGDHSLVETEHQGSASIASPGYYPSLNGAEMCDARRSGCFPYASFTGSFTEPNQVFAWKSENEYDAVTYLCNREPGELFICGGNLPDAKPPVKPGPYVARVDATTGKQIWRTYLENANISGNWIGVNNLNILANGLIVTAWSNQIVLIDPDTGRILKTGTLPSGEAPPEDSHFKHLTVAPDGTLILKNQTRAADITDQGTLAMVKGIRKGMKVPSSIFLAVDGETLEVLDTVQLPELAATPHGITMFDDRIAIYTGATEAAYRCFWDPDSKKLSLDESWQVSYLAEGQSTGDAPGIMGDWIVIQTNGIGGRVPSSVVAINQHDPARMTSIEPFGPLKRLQMSLAPPKTCVDVENNMLYSADGGVGKVAGIRLDQETGEMTTEFIVENMTLTFQPTIGPKDERVLVLTNMKGDIPKMNVLLDMVTSHYKEQVTWHDAATGRLLAESDFFE
ncbi:MAG: YncE family protein, partial [Planctomycetota bacterium]